MTISVRLKVNSQVLTIITIIIIWSHIGHNEILTSGLVEVTID